MNMQDIASVEGAMDMTPMIDMVFQLIIFFVVVNDFSSTQHEPVILPKAPVANTDKKPVSDRVLFLNVLSNGQVRANRRTLAGPGIADQVLKDFLAVEAQMAGTEPHPNAPGKNLSKLRIIIRADVNARYKWIDRIFKSCSDLGIYKTVINALKEPLDKYGG